MKPKTLIPLILGVCVGGVAIKLVVDVVSNAQGASQASMTQCVVAKMDIGFAEEITPDKLMLKPWPKDSLPEEYFGLLEDLQNRVTNMFIPKDVPIYPTMLADAGTPPGIQTLIKPGYRAVSVGIDEVTGVAYQLQPGDHVDVISLVQRIGHDGRPESISRIILHNVEIAAVGRTLHSGKAGNAPKAVARSVTLLLKPQEVTKIHLAQSNRGRISLALRGTNNNGESEEFAGVSNDQLLGRDALALNDEPGPPEPLTAYEPVKSQWTGPPKWTVTVISGKDMRQVEYQHIGGNWVSTADPNSGMFDNQPGTVPE